MNGRVYRGERQSDIALYTAIIFPFTFSN